MTVRRNAIVLAGLLGAGLLLTLALSWHLHAAAEARFPELRRPLGKLPVLIEVERAGYDKSRWHGSPSRRDPKQTELYRQVYEDVLDRQYTDMTSRLGISLYAAYSRRGEDRRHHPQICLADVARYFEDPTARKQIALDAAGQRLVQRFRFRIGDAEYMTVYYWHYTFPPAPWGDETALQRLHLGLKVPSPSVTVQVAATADLDQLAPVEAGLLPTLDTMLRRDHLPADCAIGSEHPYWTAGVRE